MEKKIVASIYGVESPSGLQLIHGNRAVTDLKHVAKIREAMKRGEVIPPVIVETMIGWRQISILVYSFSMFIKNLVRTLVSYEKSNHVLAL